MVFFFAFGITFFGKIASKDKDQVMRRTEYRITILGVMLILIADLIWLLFLGGGFGLVLLLNGFGAALGFFIGRKM